MVLKFLILMCTAFCVCLHAEVKVLAISGSSRDGSLNKKLITEAANIARQQGATVTVVDLKDYPMAFYDADLETKEGMPAKAKELRQLMVQSQVILIASPEYNSSIPAVLKNALDWASRSPEGGPSREAYQGKKFGIMSTSPGQGGGSRGLVHLKSIIENVGGTVVSQQVVVPNGMDAFDASGNLKDPQLKNTLKEQIQATVK